MEIKVVKNLEKKGIELYFDEKPAKKVLKRLKEGGFRWHNLKKCWYAKENKDTLKVAENIKGEKITKAKKVAKKINELGVKIGDIFHMSWGYEQTNSDFFKVIDLKGKTQVVLQEVELPVASETAITSMSRNVKYDIKGAKPVEHSIFVKDNEKGMIKKIKGDNLRQYISMEQSNAYIYKGGEVFESWYY